MSFDDIFAKISIYKPQISSAAASLDDISCEVRLTGRAPGAFYAAVKNGIFTLEQGEYPRSDFKISMDSDDFTALTEGRLNPALAVATGRMKIQGDLARALAFADTIRRNIPRN